MKTYIPLTDASRALVLAERDVASERRELLKWSVIALCVLAAALLGGCTSLPAKQHTGIYTIEVAGTNSMIPAIHEGELISITPCDYSRLHAGMVVAYQRASGATMIHRLIRSETFGWVAKGDHNQNYDHLTASMAELVTPENFIGIWIDERDPRTYPSP